MQLLFTFLLRLVLLAAGLVVAASLALLVTLVVLLWAARSTWARLTGQRVAPFVVRIDPLAAFGRVYRRQAQGGAAAPVEPMPRDRREIGDVTDVEVKPPRA